MVYIINKGDEMIFFKKSIDSSNLKRRDDFLHNDLLSNHMYCLSLIYISYLIILMYIFFPLYIYKNAGRGLPSCLGPCVDMVSY